MRVVIADDQVLLQTGLRRLLEANGFDVAATVGTAEKLLFEVAQHTPDLVVTDIRMPPTNTNDGFLAAVRIRETSPKTAVIVLSQHVQSGYATKLLHQGHGRVGYLMKQRITDCETFISDVHRVIEGGTALDPEIVARILRRAIQENEALASLCSQHIKILALMGEGRRDAGIARALHTTKKAVAQGASQIYAALGSAAYEDNHRRAFGVIRSLLAIPNSGLRA